MVSQAGEQNKIQLKEKRRQCHKEIKLLFKTFIEIE